MTVIIYLANIAPLAPVVMLAAGATFWLRKLRSAWIAAALVVLMAPGIILTWHLRDAGFHAFGGICGGQTRVFMETMQWVFMAQGLAGCIGSTILGGLAIRRSLAAGIMLALALMGVSLVTAFLIVFAGGMTAVDEYAC